VYVIGLEAAFRGLVSLWNDERGVLWRCTSSMDFTTKLKDTVMETKQVWVNTPFSTFAVQLFDPLAILPVGRRSWNIYYSKMIYLQNCDLDACALVSTLDLRHTQGPSRHR